MVVCPSCVEKRWRFRNSSFWSHPFWHFWFLLWLCGGSCLHLIFGGCFVWGGGGGFAVKLSLVRLWGFWQRMFAGVSQGPPELWPYGQRNPVSNSKERQLHEFTGFIFWVHGSDLTRDHCWKHFIYLFVYIYIYTHLSLSAKHTSQRSNQRYLCKNNRRKRTMRKNKQTKFWEDLREFNSRV